MVETAESADKQTVKFATEESKPAGEKEPGVKHRRHKFAEITLDNKDTSRTGIAGVLFIFCGGVLLLNTLGILPWVVWAAVFRYWPVLLILAGFYIILGHYKGVELILLIVSILIIITLWTRVLLDINSPLITVWHLDKLPWYEFIRQFGM